MSTTPNRELDRYQTEVEEKWGQTAACKEYGEKTKKYSKEKWDSLAEGMDGIFAAFAECMKNGATPGSPAAQCCVERLQNYITGNYYACTKEILAGLGQMYVADVRFKRSIDQHAAGTAEFVSQAIASCYDH